MLGFLWWGCFALAGTWAQYYLPGVDFLLPGFIVSLQEDRWPTTCWLALCFILLQEGTGSLFFGSAILVYGTVTLAYLMGQGLFDARSITLIVVLGILSGVCHFFVSLLVLRLEGMVVPTGRLFLEGAVQAVLTPVLWYLVHSLFPKGMRRNERAL